MNTRQQARCLEAALDDASFSWDAWNAALDDQLAKWNAAERKLSEMNIEAAREIREALP